MANQNLTQLPSLSSSASGDLYYVVSGSTPTDYSITFTALATSLAASLNTFTSSTKGVVSASGGGTSNFLRADGTWAVPPGGGSGITTVGAIDTAGPSSNGTTITGSSIFMQSASTSNPGLVNTATQSFIGNKTFTAGTLKTIASGDNTALQVTAGSTGQTADILQIQQNFHSNVLSGFDNKGYQFLVTGTTRSSPPTLTHDSSIGYFSDTNQLGLFDGSAWHQTVMGPTTSTAFGVAIFTDTTASAVQSVVGTGSSGQVLTSNGSSAPTFQNVPGVSSQTTYSGSVSGSAVWSMPFQGTAYKKFLINLQVLNDAGGTITFPTAFVEQPYLYGDSAAVGVSSTSTTTFTLSVAAGITGNVFVEGY